MIPRPSQALSLPLLALAGLVCSCGGADPGRDAEREPPARVREGLGVSYDCATSTDTGYVNGNPVTITLVHVDGYPVQIDTANAFLTMEAAANAEGITLGLNSGFRTMSEQEYLYACYVHCNCNDCNEAAAPGYSNHQSGHALDIDGAQ